tara:strand:+ start:2806 stop:3261 length:456 start_codon:yes stop_codon:yes gene_type:complete
MKKISKHISWKEGTFSNTAKSLKINNKPTKEIVKNMELVAEKIFEPLREWVGGPIRVNSFYRCEKLNTALKGSKTSSHTKGQAIDIDSLGKKTNAEMYDWIKDNLDFDQLIWEFGNDNPKWLHISYVSKKENRKEILKAVYRGSRLTYYRQ